MPISPNTLNTWQAAGLNELSPHILADLKTTRSMAEIAAEAAGIGSPNTTEDAANSSFETITNPETRQGLQQAYSNAEQVYTGYAIIPNKAKVIETWNSDPKYQATWDAYETSGQAPEIILSAKNLAITKWQDRYEDIALSQPDNAPNQLNKKATDGIGLYFANNTGAAKIYDAYHPDQDNIEWEITIIPTRGGYKDSGVASNVSHDLATKGPEEKPATQKITNQNKPVNRDTADFDTQEQAIQQATNQPITANNFPSVGAMLTYYASHLINQTEIPEAVYSWCNETNADGSLALYVGFYSDYRRVYVGWDVVSFSDDYLGVRASVRGDLEN